MSALGRCLIPSSALVTIARTKLLILFLDRLIDSLMTCRIMRRPVFLLSCVCNSFGMIILFVDITPYHLNVVLKNWEMRILHFHVFVHFAHPLVQLGHDSLYFTQKEMVFIALFAVNLNIIFLIRSHVLELKLIWLKLIQTRRGYGTIFIVIFYDFKSHKLWKFLCCFMKSTFTIII